MSKDNQLFLLPVFNFEVTFREDPWEDQPGGPVDLCSGAFAECTGLEATMEPKVIKEGGRNYGPAQRAGPVTFGTVVLKRGMTTTRDLWQWFDMVTNRGNYAHRMTASITVRNHAREAVFTWQLARALPIKFKSADLNARGTDVGIEELHLAHEGLTLVRTPSTGQ
jgi:phage tail-like protein